SSPSLSPSVLPGQPRLWLFQRRSARLEVLSRSRMSLRKLIALHQSPSVPCSVLRFVGDHQFSHRRNHRNKKGYSMNRSNSTITFPPCSTRLSSYLYPASCRPDRFPHPCTRTFRNLWAVQ